MVNAGMETYRGLGGQRRVSIRRLPTFADNRHQWSALNLRFTLLAELMVALSGAAHVRRVL
jgi:hypothetical protein